MKLIPSLLALSLLAATMHAQENNGITNEPKLGARKVGQAQPIFNGKDLDGWAGNKELWSVQDGAITGKTTAEKPIKHNTFLVWTGGTVDNFELTFKWKLVANNDKGFGNSGVQYRSRVNQPGENGPIVSGYQADFDFGNQYSGILYEERGRGILAQPGQKTVIKPDPADPNKVKVEVTGSVGKPDEIKAAIKQGDWNEYRVVAKGNHVQHFINGKQTVDVTDEHPKAPTEGILALQLHAGQPMTVQFKDMMLTELK
jgi:3-keto-disaccharide hydrolase